MFAKFLAFLCVLALCAPTFAWARSGGSMGGGFRSSSRSFGGSSSRSFGGSSSRSSSPSYGGSSYGGTRYVPIPIPIGGGYGGGYGYGGGGYYRTSSGGGGIFMVLIIIVVFAGGVYLLVRWQASRKGKAEDEADKLIVGRYDFGVQALARDMQDRLEAMAARVDTSSSEGLAAMLREVALELRRHIEHVAFASAELQGALARESAEQQFLMIAGDARSQYGREIVRADQQGVRRQQKEVATDGIRDEDGQLSMAEFFVVTVIVAVRGVKLVARVDDAQQVQQALATLSAIPAVSLEAVEVVWSPASKSDAMDRDDMALRYPRLMSV